MRRLVPKMEFPMSKGEQVLVDIADSVRPVRFSQNNFEGEFAVFINDAIERDDAMISFLRS